MEDAFREIVRTLRRIWTITPDPLDSASMHVFAKIERHALEKLCQMLLCSFRSEITDMDGSHDGDGSFDSLRVARRSRRQRYHAR